MAAVAFLGSATSDGSGKRRCVTGSGREAARAEPAKDMPLSKVKRGSERLLMNRPHSAL